MDLPRDVSSGDPGSAQGAEVPASKSPAPDVVVGTTTEHVALPSQSAPSPSGGTESADPAVVESDVANPPQSGADGDIGSADPAPERIHDDEAPSDQHSLQPQTEEDSSSFGTPSTFSVGLSVDTDDDGDSALGSISGESSMSATSSVYNFIEEFGRTFHKYKEGKYFLPNDEQEIGRLDLQHRIALQVLEFKLHLAPIERAHRVLDVGTGTGIWAIEFAEKNQECDVLGTDLSPIQPEYVPANCRFEIDDCEDEWVYSQKFDYIHGRYMCLFLSNIPKLFRQAYENMNPGGWIEFMEMCVYFQSHDGTLEGTALQRWNKLLLEGIKKMGRNALSCLKYKKWMEQAGFRNVEERRFVVPTCPWAKGKKNKQLGALQMVNNLNGVYGLTMTVFTRGLGWEKEEVEVFLADVRRDMGDKDIHAYITIMAVYGQRPH